MPDGFDRVFTDCRALAIKIEELLALRRRETALRPYRLKTWTQAEFCDLAYSSYKSMLAGIVRYPPRRQVILQIAEYLECTVEERNALLLAADYTPEKRYLDGSQLAEMLQQAEQTIAGLPMPAFVLTRDWQVRSANQPLHVLAGELIVQVINSAANLLQQLFDPQLPLRAQLSQYPDHWERTARRELARFKHDNLLAQGEGWYLEMLRTLMDYPEFASYWEASDDLNSPLAINELDLLTPAGLLISVRLLDIHICLFDYPRIRAFLPANAQADKVFRELGIALPERSWQQQDPV